MAATKLGVDPNNARHAPIRQLSGTRWVRCARSKEFLTAIAASH
jgi:hypothetical protein